MIMNVFEIKTNKSDYPYLVIAGGFGKAVEMLNKKGLYDTDIISVKKLEAFTFSHILIEDRIVGKENLREEVSNEVLADMPRWISVPNGAAGGADRDIYLVRTSRGNYFTSKCIGGGEGHYLMLDALEQLPGLPKED
jgi:hypothetical protein